MIADFESTAADIHKEIEKNLQRSGLLCRVFSRGKSNNSLNKKLGTMDEYNNYKYHNEGKKIQDAIGVRVVLYFPDDIELAEKIISKVFTKKTADCTIDLPDGNTFSATRYNLIYEIPTNLVFGVKSEINKRPIDTTFEVQIRTILSEGWHEVEHDLRYKNKDYWDNHDNLNRALNGIVATLETSEWSMQKIFDELCYMHYKNQNWSAMIIFKLRLRLSGELSSSLNEIFHRNKNLSKSFFRSKRSDLIELFGQTRIPVTLDNAIYIWNFTANKNKEIIDITPELIIRRLETKQ